MYSTRVIGLWGLNNLQKVGGDDEFKAEILVIIKFSLSRGSYGVVELTRPR